MYVPYQRVQQYIQFNRSIKNHSNHDLTPEEGKVKEFQDSFNMHIGVSLFGIIKNRLNSQSVVEFSEKL